MKSKSTKSISAAELMAQLQREPGFMRMNVEREAQQRAVETHLKADERPIVDELAGAGIRVSSIWDLVNARWSYTAAIPVLTRHLRLTHHPKTLEGIARALTVREARGIAGRPILDELKRSNELPQDVRWALANALTEAADLEMVQDIKALVVDAQYKDVREILRIALKNLSVH